MNNKLNLDHYKKRMINCRKDDMKMTSEHTHVHINLTAAEISSLWVSYQNDTLNICAISFFLTHVEDPQIREILEESLNVAKDNKAKADHFFRQIDHPVPRGFTDEDVNFEAPRLFTDKIYLHYILNITNLNITADTTAITLAARSDLIDFYTKKLELELSLHNKALDLAKQQGTYIRTSIIPNLNKVEFVQKDKFLTGWFGDRRPLLGIEIANLEYAALRNALGQAGIIGFSQVAESKEVRQYFEKGRDIARKHNDIFNDILSEDYLPGARAMTAEVTDSTVAPFSDKLMMNVVTTLIATGIAQYGAAMSVSLRHDLSLTYTRLMAEIAKYSNEGANILLKNGWMEQPPIAADREKLPKR